MTSTTLVGILREIYERDLFDGSTGIKPFMFLDGHGSRTEPDYIQHANIPPLEWAICLGVSCGTSLWQVSDSSD